MSDSNILGVSHSLNSKLEYTVFKGTNFQDVGSKALFSLFGIMLRLKISDLQLLTMIQNFPVIPSESVEVGEPIPCHKVLGNILYILILSIFPPFFDSWLQSSYITFQQFQRSGGFFLLFYFTYYNMIFFLYLVLQHLFFIQLCWLASRFYSMFSKLKREEVASGMIHYSWVLFFVFL